MPKTLYKEVPVDFAVCQHEDCPRADKCLRQISYKPLLEQNNYLQLVNPNHCTKDDKCPHYRDSTPVTYARGFTKMQQRMYPDQNSTFVSILKGRFGHNPYYERRRGDFALTPREQKFVRYALKRAGVTEELEFDRYEETYNWFD